MGEEIKLKSSLKRIAVVTGANRGIGLEICRQLAKNKIMVILTARDEKKGNNAVAKLKESGLSDVIFHQLDVTDLVSIASLAYFIKIQFGKIDILVNNAGINGLFIDYEALGGRSIEGLQITDLYIALRQTYETMEECININYRGTREVTSALLPFLLLSTSPRIVMVSAEGGKLKNVISDGGIRAELNRIVNVREERLDELCQLFLTSVKEDRLSENGWLPGACAYNVSKLLVNFYTRTLAKRYPDFCINSVHPGFVKTDMNWNTGILPVEEGAKGPVMLALLPDGGFSGVFFDQTEPSSFE